MHTGTPPQCLPTGWQPHPNLASPGHSVQRCLGEKEGGNVEEGTPAHRRRAGEREVPRGCSPVQPRPHPPAPRPSGLTLLTVAPSKARAASPLQRRHRAVGHSVCGPDQSPVTNTRAASGQYEHLSAAPGPAPAESAQPRPSGSCLGSKACHPSSVPSCVAPSLSASDALSSPFQLCLPTSPHEANYGGEMIAMD